MNMNFYIQDIKNVTNVKRTILEIKIYHKLNCLIDTLNEHEITVNDDLYDDLFNTLIILEESKL